jgi:hypothetical protein
MTQTQDEWLRNQWDEYKESNGCSPNLDEWEELVRENASEMGSPPLDLSEERKTDCILEAFNNFQIQEIAGTEISTKARDAEANLNNRSYNDANF